MLLSGLIVSLALSLTPAVVASECTVGCYDQVTHVATTVFATSAPSQSQPIATPTHFPSDITPGEFVIADEGVAEIRWTRYATSTMFVPHPTSTEDYASTQGWTVLYETTSMDWAGYTTSIVAPTLTSIAPRPTALPPTTEEDILVSWSSLHISSESTVASVTNTDYSYDTVIWVRPESGSASEPLEVLVDGNTSQLRMDAVSIMGRFCENNIEECFDMGIMPGYYIIPSGEHEISFIRTAMAALKDWDGFWAIERPSLSISDLQCPPCPSHVTVTQYIPAPTPPPASQLPIEIPAAPCVPTSLTPWTKFYVQKSQGTAMSVELPFDYGYPTTLWIADDEYRTERFQVALDGMPIGVTSDFVSDKTVYCGTDIENCIRSGFGYGKFPVPEGKHTVRINWIGKDSDLPYYSGSWKLESRCGDEEFYKWAL